MSNSQRRKGACGERELAKALSELLNLDISRNLDQTRDGGHDLDGLPFALEVKRQEKLSLGKWWRQAVEQANGRPPVLAYRQSRKPWRFVVPVMVMSEGIHVIDNPMYELDYTIEMGIELFCELVTCSIQKA